MIDYMIMEAVYLKVLDEDQKAQAEAKRKQTIEEARQRLVKEFGQGQ